MVAVNFWKRQDLFFEILLSKEVNAKWQLDSLSGN